MRNQALFTVQIGLRDREAGHVDNWRSQNVLAPTALMAIKKVKLFSNEYVAEVRLIGRSET